VFTFSGYKPDEIQNYIDFISPYFEWQYLRAKTATNADEDLAKQEP
jgi:hypothetical protein